MLVNPGDTVLVEEPVCPVILAAVRFSLYFII